MYVKKCPDCSHEIQYKFKINYEYSIKNNVLCKLCRHQKTIDNQILTRQCPKCNKELTYSSFKNRNSAEKKQKTCVDCAWTHEKRVQSGKVAYTKGLAYLNQVGESNSFYGKHHTEETKEKIRNNTDRSYMQSSEFKQKMSAVTSGDKNPMHGQSFYDVWVDKYGIDEANRRMEAYKNKQSINASGKNNPMYGKSSPQGSGNGWSGWYKNWFFRSLGELSYVINVIEITGRKWKSAEKIRISYTNWDGAQRTYAPDFIFDSYLIECKPKKLHNTPLVLLKKQAGEQYCEKHGLSYLLVDPPKMCYTKLLELYQQNKIIFTSRYVQKMEQWILSHDIEKLSSTNASQ